MPQHILKTSQTRLIRDVYLEIVLIIMREFIPDYPGWYIKGNDGVATIEFTDAKSFLEFVDKAHNIDRTVKEIIKFLEFKPSDVTIRKRINTSKNKKTLISKIFNKLSERINIKAVLSYSLKEGLGNNFMIEIKIQVDIKDSKLEHKYVKKINYFEGKIIISLNHDLNTLNFAVVETSERSVTGLILDLTTYMLEDFHDKIMAEIEYETRIGNKYLEEVFEVFFTDLIYGEKDIEMLTAAQYLEKLCNYLKHENYYKTIKLAIENIGLSKIIKHFLEKTGLKEDEVIFYPFFTIQSNPYKESFVDSFRRFLFRFYDFFLSKRRYT